MHAMAATPAFQPLSDLHLKNDWWQGFLLTESYVRDLLLQEPPNVGQPAHWQKGALVPRDSGVLACRRHRHQTACVPVPALPLPYQLCTGPHTQEGPTLGFLLWYCHFTIPNNL